MSKQPKIVVVVPNWNGADDLRTCLDSLVAQSVTAHIIVVDNGSVDNSVTIVEKYYPSIELIRHAENMGYAGGVNPGFRRAIEMKYDYAAPFNNDAVADKNWLKYLVAELEKNEEVGVAACKLLSGDKRYFDSTGDIYTAWGLPFPRGRDEKTSGKYDQKTDIFGASGGASLYRVKMLEQVGLMDEDFFAYYEDVDLSFRAQLAGWKIRFVPTSEALHQIGATSGKIKGFTTRQTMKNLPWIIWKDVPGRLLPKILPRFCLAYASFWLSAVARGHGWAATRGATKSLLLLGKKLAERRTIQKNRKVSVDYMWQIMEHDLPPNARRLRKLRSSWWSIAGRKAI